MEKHRLWVIVRDVLLLICVPGALASMFMPFRDIDHGKFAQCLGAVRQLTVAITI